MAKISPLAYKFLYASFTLFPDANRFRLKSFVLGQVEKCRKIRKLSIGGPS
jgi:hypothetical protein